MRTLLIFTFLFICGVNSTTASTQNVKIDNSIVIGYKHSDNIIAYTGIPYAQAPINNLRFEPPQKPQYNDVINDKSKENVMCAQVSVFNGPPEISGDEDCLYLNVYVPTTLKNDDLTKLPVMIYIHGGGFAWGTGIMFKPDYLLRNDNVILVTLNYRLGPLGFLAAGSEGHEIYANNGMKDQAMAIQWVYDNIQHFGGDNTKITLFGNSAGAASTHLHLFSPKTKGLFHAAILESGAAVCHWAVHTFKNMVNLSTQLSRLANCPVLPTEDMIKCLKDKSLDEILYSTAKFIVFDVDPMVLFTPAVEPAHKDAFLIDFPENLLKNGDFYDVPIMQGTTTDEGAIRTSLFAKHPETIEKCDKYFHELYRPTNNKHHYTMEQITAIKKHYFGNGMDLKSLTAYWSDEYFRCTDDTVTLHYKHSQSAIYSFFFNYKGALTFSKYFAGDENVDLGICHMDELFYLFPLEYVLYNFPNADKAFTVTDKKMSLFMTKLWTHFAQHKNFDDFIDNDGIKLDWKPVHSTHNEYLIIDKDFTFKMGKDLFYEANQFWNELENKNNNNYITNNKDEL